MVKQNNAHFDLTNKIFIVFFLLKRGILIGACAEIHLHVIPGVIHIRRNKMLSGRVH